MNDVKSLSHSKREREGHVVCIPKCRGKQLYGGVSGKYILRVGKGTGKQDTGRTSVSRPRAYADRDTAKIRCSPRGRIY
jgi:hypothetical protein